MAKNRKQPTVDIRAWGSNMETVLQESIPDAHVVDLSSPELPWLRNVSVELRDGEVRVSIRFYTSGGEFATCEMVLDHGGVLRTLSSTPTLAR